MNCENYQVLLSDLVDGTLTAEDCQRVELHLSSCADCADARNDLRAIVDFCRETRGQYDAVPNQRALWLRISNIIEADNDAPRRANVPGQAAWWFRLMNRSWQLSFPQMAAAVASIVLVVAVVTVFSVRNLPRLTAPGVTTAGLGIPSTNVPIEDRYRQQQQAIAYWNDRVELNKARWNPQMRDTFERNMGVIDTAVNNSMNRLRVNPHDEVSEEILNDALNDKLALLKEFSDL